jgi:hypothetical protein
LSSLNPLDFPGNCWNFTQKKFLADPGFDGTPADPSLVSSGPTVENLFLFVLFLIDPNFTDHVLRILRRSDGPLDSDVEPLLDRFLAN